MTDYMPVIQADWAAIYSGKLAAEGVTNPLDLDAPVFYSLTYQLLYHPNSMTTKRLTADAEKWQKENPGGDVSTATSVSESKMDSFMERLGGSGPIGM